LEYTVADEGIILKINLEEWTEFIWFTIDTSGELLGTCGMFLDQLDYY
jgi:hypothetical protein